MEPGQEAAQPETGVTREAGSTPGSRRGALHALGLALLAAFGLQEAGANDRSDRKMNRDHPGRPAPGSLSTQAQ